MICKLRKNDYPEIELLFGEQYICNYRSYVYNLYEFEQVDSVSFNLDFYKQFLQEETEEEAKEWCLKTVERNIFEYLCEISETDSEDETNHPKEFTDFFDDYEYLSDCVDELKKYSEAVMHDVWKNQEVSKKIFKVGQDFSVVREVDHYRNGNKLLTLNLFPEMYSDTYFYVSDKSNSSGNFYISEISKFDSTSYKLELRMNETCGDGAITNKLKFIVQKGDVLTFKYYQKDEKTYFVDATVTNIKNNEIEFEFGLFDENCLLD